MTRLDEYLASNEELILSFSATGVTKGEEDDDSTPFDNLAPTSSYEFGATDRRIVYLSDDGNFKDIDYSHISSIQSESERDESELTGPLTLGCCGGLLFFAALGAITDNPGQGLLFLLVGGGLVYGAVKWGQAANLSEKEKITFITGDESHQQITVTLAQDQETNVSAELSRILREKR